MLLAGEFRLESVFRQVSTYSKLILKAFKEYNMITAVVKYEFALTCSVIVFKVYNIYIYKYIYNIYIYIYIYIYI